jgi:hypothetical protein
VDNEKTEAELQFESLAAIVPERGDDTDDDDEIDAPSHKTLKQAEAAPNLSDAQAAMKTLMPDTGHKHLNLLQVSRVFPDSYIPYQAILVKDLMLKDESLSLAEAITLAHTAESIAVDGDGRIDVITILGAAKASDRDAEKMAGL